MALRDKIPVDVDDKMKSIQHALSILNEAAADSTEEIKGALRELGKASLVSVGRARDQVIESSKVAAKSIDNSVHTYPWAFVSGAALLGFLLGRRSKSGFNEVD